jgi:hypothetical protein
VGVAVSVQGLAVPSGHDNEPTEVISCEPPRRRCHRSSGEHPLRRRRERQRPIGGPARGRHHPRCAPDRRAEGDRRVGEGAGADRPVAGLSARCRRGLAALPGEVVDAGDGWLAVITLCPSSRSFPFLTLGADVSPLRLPLVAPPLDALRPLMCRRCRRASRSRAFTGAPKS